MSKRTDLNINEELDKLNGLGVLYQRLFCSSKTPTLHSGDIEPKIISAIESIVDKLQDN